MPPVSPTRRVTPPRDDPARSRFTPPLTPPLSLYAACGQTGWIWLIGNLTITLSVNFGFASLISACITLYDADFTAEAWQLLLIFYAVCLFSLVLCVFANKILPYVDTASAAFTAVTIVVTLIALSVKAGVGRSSISQAFGNYDKSLAGWGGFTFFIGLLPVSTRVHEIHHCASSSAPYHVR